MSGKLIVVYSTLASDMSYTNHRAGGADVPVVDGSVFIKGGAGVANDRIVTAQGVASFVTAAQLETLEQNEVFKLHKANGFIVVSDEKMDPEKMAADMNNNDPSRPLNDLDLTKDDPSLKVADNAGSATAKRK
jgi:hypothetical protein